MSDFATRSGPNAIRFERTIAAPVDRVWSLLTTPAGLATWFAETTLDLHVGGDFVAQLTPQVEMRGRIVALEPNRKLVLAWREIYDGEATDHATTADRASQISCELEPIAGGTKLTFVHELISGDDNVKGFASGWHCYLDALRASAEGVPDPETSFEELSHAYDTRFS